MHNALVFGEVHLRMKRFTVGIDHLDRCVETTQSVPSISKRNLRDNNNDGKRQENLAGTCHHSKELLVICEIHRRDMFADLTTKLSDSDMLRMNGVRVEPRAIVEDRY